MLIISKLGTGLYISLSQKLDIYIGNWLRVKRRDRNDRNIHTHIFDDLVNKTCFHGIGFDYYNWNFFRHIH